MKGVPEMNKKLLIFKRKKAKELHEKGWGNRKIARYILASKNSVGRDKIAKRPDQLVRILCFGY